jgi:hypothetical protein
MIEITAIGAALMLTASGVAVAGLALEALRRMLGRALQSPVADHDLWTIHSAT